MKYSKILFAALFATILFSCQKPEEEEPLPPMKGVDAELWDEVIKAAARTDVLNDAYYKEVFLDGGTDLTSRQILPSCDSFNISQEYFNASANTTDSLMQLEVFTGSEMDHNGILLFPDGAPRYKLFYSCGGSSKDHGKYLAVHGRNAVRDFNHAGGSYLGSCAGAFLAAAKRNGSYMPQYYGIWPGTTTESGLSKSATGMFIDEGSPLLKFFDFGGDHYVDSVRHNGGCYNTDMYPGTEVLARYDKPDKPMHENAAVWAWKGSPYYGRVICCGSHPEEVISGERMHFFAAMLFYGFEGRGIARAKGILPNGEVYVADKDSRDNDPAHAKIGDGQCHHYLTAIPKTAKNIRFRLEYSGDYDIRLLVKKDSFAFEDVADYKDVSSSGVKEIKFDTLPSGTWYIGVYNTSRPEVYSNKYGLCNYSGKTELLNGIAYSVSVTWE
ncbi:MAG: hypothetical protein J5495_04830 [Bacteroidales bacterium]|nr:hypothetical protein [Bacteroidales bacterium]